MSLHGLSLVLEPHLNGFLSHVTTLSKVDPGLLVRGAASLELRLQDIELLG